MLLDRILVPVGISLKTAVIATVITFCLGVLAAYWMSQYRGKGKGLIDGIFTAPLVLPPTVLGFLLLVILGKNGAVGKLLDLVDIRIIFTWYATVIAATVVAFPLMYKTALAAFEQNRGDLIACARTLGASETTIFWRITLPLAKPGLIAGTLLSFARALGEFGATLMLAGSIPGKTQTIPIAIFIAAESGAMNLAFWLTIILLSISLGVVVSVNSWQNKSDRTRTNSRLRGSSKKLLTQQDRQDVYLIVDIQKQLSEFCLDVALEINSHQASLGILGASGAGKTTLLRCIAGLETPDRGRIVLNGKTLFDSTQGINLPPQARGVGLLLQNYGLFPHLTVGDNIAFGMSAKQSTSAIKTEVAQQLAKIGLSTYGDRLPQELSGGEQQRVALARALASNPAITLLDEPCSALDTNLKAKLLELLQQRLSNYSGLTLYITHNLAEAYYLCSHLLIIDRGKAIAYDQKQNIINCPPNFKTSQLVGYRNFSVARSNTSNTILAIDWQCLLKVDRSIPKNLNQIAIRTSAVTFTQTKSGINIFAAWLVKQRELPNLAIVYLKLNSAPNSSDDYYLEVEVNFNLLSKLQQQEFPWYIYLPPSKIIMFDATTTATN